MRGLGQTSERKSSHIYICAEMDVQARSTRTGFDDAYLVHRALPEMSLKEIDASTEFFGKELSAPIVIEAMTGGTEEATAINAALARAAENLNIAMGVGSQRAAIEDPRHSSTFRIVREEAPHAFLISNLGAPQLAKGYGLREAERAVEMIDADALAIHLNPLQEAVQPDGDTCYRGVSDRIRMLSESLSVPIIVKETGAGIAAEEARLLEGLGVKGIDVSGAGGTSWAAVEHFRAGELGDLYHEGLGRVFWDWGIPTLVSLVEVCQSTELSAIASGGIRSGIDAAKAIAVGAEAVGLAQPLLKQAMEGYERVDHALRTLIGELKTAMFLTGSASTKELRASPLVITGRTADWLEARGFHPERYARRASA